MTRHETVVGDDGLGRGHWAASHPVSRHLHDTEWGVPVRGETALLERISLEAFQSELCWRTILDTRPAFHAAFHGFAPEVVAGFTDVDVDHRMDDAGIVRNRLKIEAARTNARATLAPRSVADVPTRIPHGVSLSTELRRHGFAFVGPMTAFALMEAIGMVDTHLLGCHRHGSSELWSRSAGSSRLGGEL
jgi:DNA-3-methyladenine glycosylase I